MSKTYHIIFHLTSGAEVKTPELEEVVYRDFIKYLQPPIKPEAEVLLVPRGEELDQISSYFVRLPQVESYEVQIVEHPEIKVREPAVVTDQPKKFPKIVGEAQGVPSGSADTDRLGELLS